MARTEIVRYTAFERAKTCIIAAMDMSNPLPPGGSIMEPVPAAAWQRPAFNQSTNWTNRRTPLPLLATVPSFVFPGVAAIENAPVFEMPTEINVQKRMFLFYAIREIVSNRESIAEIIRQWWGAG